MVERGIAAEICYRLFAISNNVERIVKLRLVKSAFDEKDIVFVVFCNQNDALGRRNGHFAWAKHGPN